MMKKISTRQKKFSRGMTAAILCGLLAVGAATFIGVKETAKEINNQTEVPSSVSLPSSISDDSAEWLDSDSTTASTDVTSEPDTTQTMAQSETDTSDTVSNDSKDKRILTGFIMPVEGEIITPYSNGEMVKSLTLNDWRTHDGIDIAAEQGTPVKACNSGEVSEIKIDPLWGTTITLSHSDGSKSYYMGLSKSIPVNKGQQVTLGEVIGNVGNTAEIEQALESHLHFAMKKDGHWIDPTSLEK